MRLRWLGDGFEPLGGRTMRVFLTSGLAGLAVLASMPVWAENGIGQIKSGVPAANQKVGTLRP